MRRVGLWAMVLLVCAWVLGSCGQETCLDCVDCPDFTGLYSVHQVPIGDLCEAYNLVDGTFTYEVTRQAGNGLEIHYVGAGEEVYRGQICGSADEDPPRAYPFGATYVDVVDELSVTISLNGEFVEAWAGAPAQMNANIDITLVHANDSRFNCSMLGESSGERIE